MRPLSCGRKHIELWSQCRAAPLVSRNRVQRAHHFVAGCGAMRFLVNHAPPSRDPSTINSITWHGCRAPKRAPNKHLSRALIPIWRVENEDGWGQMSREANHRNANLCAYFLLDRWFWSTPFSGGWTILDDVKLLVIDQLVLWYEITFRELNTDGKYNNLRYFFT